MARHIGGYRITHPRTGVFYVGSTSDFSKRKHDHLKRLKKGEHYSHKLQAAFQEDQKLEFDFHPAPTREEAYDWEQQQLTEKRGDPLMANTHLDARGAAGTTRSEKAKAKTSASLRGRTFSDGHRGRISAASKGVPKSEAHRESLSKAHGIPVVIDGVRYRSKKEAAAALGVGEPTVARRIRSDDPAFNGWQAL